jgi:hypothetical protein
MKIRNDGSVQPSSTPTPENAGRREDFAIYRCVISKVIYADDPTNITTNSGNPRVLYDVVVLGGFSSGQIISNCRLASTLGGDTSFYERVLRASTIEVSGSRLSSSDGDIVYVAFVQGHTGYPVIIALDNGINTAGKIGANLTDGPRSIMQFNGVREEINKDGEWIFQRNGGTANSVKGSFEPASAAEVTFNILKDEKHTRIFKSGLTIEENGKDDKVKITTTGGAIAEIDGKSGKITLTKGATIIELDGTGDKISLKSGFIDLGASVSDFAVLFTELLNAFNTHSHPFIDITPGGPVPSVTMPPVAPMLQTVGSLTVKVQP